nr:hypothetical protein [Tanacetum cinerariifolium]
MSDLEAAVAAKASKVTTLADCDSLRNEVVGEAKMREEFTSQQDAVELEGLKDSSLALIMSALTLKDEHGNTDTTPELRQFHPSFDQVTIPIYFEFGSISSEMLLSDVIPAIRGSSEKSWLCLPPSSASGGVFSSAPRHDSSLGVTDYQVSPLVLSGDRAPATQPPVTQTHDDLFDTSILDKHAGCSLVRDRFAITAYIDGDAYMISNFSRSSSRTSRLSSRASSFMAWSIFAHLNKGIPISTGITTSLSHTRENEVCLLLVLIMVRCAHSTCGTSSTQFLFYLPNLALIPSPRLRFVLSTCPLVCGCLTDANLCLIFSLCSVLDLDW